ncbi:DUF1971 domain-containing protein [Comamonas sp.]|uniref:DUF1971 domain-containing protein n=1 Tax=Comamonas sp. TaxID=34028 RepID=UPI00283AB38F|nr:DUF1971 domain-containing protein [Comamonas sp.]
MFTQDTVPAGLLRDHVTREGTWALIHVLEGELLYRVPGWDVEQVLYPAAAPGVVLPQVPHSVQPAGSVRFFVEFYALQPQEQASRPGLPSTGLVE